MIHNTYPRPHLYRKNWQSLNGIWEFDFFDDYLVTSELSRIQANLTRQIEVPFSYQSNLSGIASQDYHPCMVYRKKICFSNSTEILKPSTKENLLNTDYRGCVLLHFGASDFKTSLWINRQYVGSHTGGYTPFTFDITPWLSNDELVIAVEVIDTLNPEQPRGKQSWANPTACWYTPFSGIWQTVWLEFVPKTYIIECTTKTDIEEKEINCFIKFNQPCPKETEIRYRISFKGSTILTDTRVYSEVDNLTFSSVLCHAELWDSENPNLYDVSIALYSKREDNTLPLGELHVDNQAFDEVTTYTAFRKVEWGEQGFLINGSQKKLRLVLNQGYWPESGYTAPHEKAFKDDIILIKCMGFNGCRMHMKFEDPRFYYWADQLGLYVWEEAPAFYSFCDTATTVFFDELLQTIKNNSMHPSIIARVICNESWGVKDIGHNIDQQRWLLSIVHAVKEADPSRPVIDNDGWEHLPGQILTFHSYEHDAQKLEADWRQIRSGKNGGVLGKELIIRNCSFEEAISEENVLQDISSPMLLTEFGGLSFIEKYDIQASWGYGQSYTDSEAFFLDLLTIIKVAEALPNCTGWCYTQFYDVFQEKNGLLFADRRPKFPINRLREFLESL